MWIDKDGVSHTVALPEPAELMSDDFRSGLDVLLMTQREQVEQVVEAAQMQIFEQDLLNAFPTNGEHAFEGMPPPNHLLVGEPLTVNDLASALGRTDLRWRLDAALAIEDYID